VLAVLALVYLARPAWIYLSGSGQPVAQARCGIPGTEEWAGNTPRPNSGVTKVIRLNKLGEFEDRCELTDALNELAWDVGPRAASGMQIPRYPGAMSRPKLVVLYIHGWLHDGAEDDDNLVSFKEVVRQLAERRKDISQVTGIYVGWPGKWNIPIVDYLSFWGRMQTADRIAQSAVVTRIIGIVDSILAQSNLPGNTFITIGHSLGARMLFSATSQNLIYAIQQGHPGVPWGEYRTVNGLTDAVVLLNPAFEASQFTSLNAVEREDETFPPSQLPLLLSVSTSNDRVTQFAFPAAQWLTGWTAEREIQTLGNYERFATHDLVRTTQPGECKSAARFRHRPTEALSVAQRPEPQVLFPVPEQVNPLAEAHLFAGLCLRRRPAGTQPFNPFMVAATTPDILYGHSGIWQREFADWLSGYLDALGAAISLSKMVRSEK
jgi:hypothetical protein